MHMLPLVLTAGWCWIVARHRVYTRCGNPEGAFGWHHARTQCSSTDQSRGFSNSLSALQDRRVSYVGLTAAAISWLTLALT